MTKFFFQELVAFKEEFGHLPTTIYKTSSGYGLGFWVRRQQVIKGKLTPERIERLDALGFVWNTKQSI